MGFVQVKKYYTNLIMSQASTFIFSGVKQKNLYCSSFIIQLFPVYMIYIFNNLSTKQGNYSDIASYKSDTLFTNFGIIISC